MSLAPADILLVIQHINQVGAYNSIACASWLTYNIIIHADEESALDVYQAALCSYEILRSNLADRPNVFIDYDGYSASDPTSSLVQGGIVCMDIDFPAMARNRRGTL
ncbi:hypothetical protein CVT25_005035 [Psilocybe cyanescens]|uniref:Uncharacterized protein n=1 Tax=Psilocybe cyanescens TaxID=93625 RepID=A0A409XIY6_PSICY|nr:hypothetical protein CVT25_005035 [Psilocybe cyanescens]